MRDYIKKYPAISVILFICILLTIGATASGPSRFTLAQWNNLDIYLKLDTIKGVIEMAKKDNVIITLSPEYYVAELDAVIVNSVKNRDENHIKTTSVGIAFHTIAAMEGDWGNGENKLEHAKKWMRSKNFEDFKIRYPMKYNKLKNNEK